MDRSWAKLRNLKRDGLRASKHVQNHSQQQAADNSNDKSPSPQQQQQQQQQPPEKTRLPYNYMNCDMKSLIKLVAEMLTELTRLNDNLPLKPSGLTRFHSKAPPSITPYDYLIRLAKYCYLEKSTVLTMIFFIDLFCGVCPSFTVNSLTVHRFIITAITVASKGLCDSFCTNTHYAKVGGLSLGELNLLEVEFLIRVKWTIIPQPEALVRYYHRMASRMTFLFILDPEPVSSRSVVMHHDDGDDAAYDNDNNHHPNGSQESLVKSAQYSPFGSKRARSTDRLKQAALAADGNTPLLPGTTPLNEENKTNDNRTNATSMVLETDKEVSPKRPRR